QGRAARPRGRAAGTHGARGPRRRPARQRLRRPGPAGHDRAGADARAARAVPGRAVHRARPAVAHLRPRLHPRAEGQGRHRRPHHAPDGGGGAALRPGRHGGPRPAAGPGRPGRPGPRAARQHHAHALVRARPGLGRGRQRGAYGRRDRRAGRGDARGPRQALHLPRTGRDPARRAQGAGGSGHRPDRPGRGTARTGGRLPPPHRTGAAMTTLLDERPPTARAFLAVLGRDLVVTWRELPTFLAQAFLQPLFILFVFGKVLGDLGYVGNGFGDVLLPGIVALNAFVGGLQNTALPLTLDFSFSREIEDRLLSPLPTRLAALEKIVFGTIRGVVSGAAMIPLGLLILPDTSLALGSLPPALAVMALGAFVGSAVGMVVGTAVSPRGINVVFTVVLTPLMFTGATQFPWPGLDRLPWFQVVCAVNPLTYVSEGMRAVMVPQVPHIPLWLCLLVLVAAGAVAAEAGMRGFNRRAQD